MNLLVVNLARPELSQYREIKGFGSWFWGRRLSHYRVYLCNRQGIIERIPLYVSDVNHIDQTIADAQWFHRKKG